MAGAGLESTGRVWRGEDGLLGIEGFITPTECQSLLEAAEGSGYQSIREVPLPELHEKRLLRYWCRVSGRTNLVR